ncbi:MAG: LysR family transcriptional regulator [Clostridia bacterium]|nr:LysR family transcriptional regulator [Clostridia bacterium]
MELLQLRYFFESAKTESFSKTAEKYMVPITSVSASVKRLEQELGCQLFDRRSNSIVLNDNGRRLQKSLFMIFDQLDRVKADLSPDAADTREIKLSVRALRSAVTDYIIEYKALHPSVDFNTVFDFGSKEHKSFHIIIDDDPERYPGYESFELCSKLIRLRAAADDPLCGKKIHLRDLCSRAFVSFGEHTSTHKMLVDACKKQGFTPDFAVQTNDLQCYTKYVEAGIGIGFGRFDAGDPVSRNIRYLDVVDFTARQTVYVIFDPHQDHGNVREFLEFLRSKCV